MSKGKAAVNDAASIRRVQVADLRLQGMTIQQIADEIGVDPRTIHKDLQVLRDGWQTRMAQSYDTHMAVRFERANAIFTKAWKGYAATVSEKLPGGNPTLLEIARKAELDIRTLLGLPGPIEFQGKRVSSEDGAGTGLVDIVEVVVDSREELVAITGEDGIISLAGYQKQLQEAVKARATKAQGSGEVVKEMGT